MRLFARQVFKTELKELDRFASENGLELIPCIQTLAHLGGITRWDEYKPYTNIDDNSNNRGL